MVHKLDLTKLSNKGSPWSKIFEATVQELMTDDDEDVVLVEILFCLAMYLTVDSKNTRVEFVRSIADASTLDSGMLSVKQVTVDMIAQLPREWKIFSRGRDRRVVHVRRYGGLLVICAEFTEAMDRRK
jgi:hypothetical protein